MDINEKALLVSLKISSWSGRRFDSAVTREVDEAHNTEGAGRYNKILIDLKESKGRSSLKDVKKIEGRIRTLNYDLTLPWTDGGDRVLPAAKFYEYTEKMNELKEEFNDSVEGFISIYPELVEDAAKRLNGMFNPQDYPTPGAIRSRFYMDVGFCPVPSLNDFRVNIASKDVAQLEKEIEQNLMKKHKAATQELFERARIAIGRIIETVSKTDKKFRNSMIGNVEHLVEVLPSFNYTADPKVDELVTEMKALLIDPDTIRTDKKARKKYLKRAQELNDMFF